MTFEQYYMQFESIINKNSIDQNPPYNQAEYFEYTQLNWSRLNRWLKKGELSAESKKVLRAIHTPQQWLVITEPWCGDAAHIVPFIELMRNENANISINYELRDSEPFSIEKYLTDGAKSIPKLIVRNEKGEDCAVWGPRPQACAAVFSILKAKGTPFEEMKIALQKWYNTDKGQEIQKEITQLLKSL
jgi:hypothetical protein